MSKVSRWKFELLVLGSKDKVGLTHLTPGQTEEKIGEETGLEQQQMGHRPRPPTSTLPVPPLRHSPTPSRYKEKTEDLCRLSRSSENDRHFPTVVRTQRLRRDPLDGEVRERPVKEKKVFLKNFI